MKKWWILTAVLLIVAGLALAGGAFLASGFDLSRFSSAKIQTNTYIIPEEFSGIDIHTLEADIRFLPSSDDSCQVVCSEQEKVQHTVLVDNGTLQILARDERKWIDHISFFSLPHSVEIYLPKDSYDSLTILASTGDISVPASFSFAKATVTTSTGDIDFASSVSGLLELSAGTGDISLSGIQAGDISLSVSTGKIQAESVSCQNAFHAYVSTGKAFLKDLSCKELHSSGNTGNLTLQDVLAEIRFELKRSTGDIRFENCDAAEILVQTSTGDVTGTLRSDKVFLTKTSTGRIRVPDSVIGGKCAISTTTGDIEISIAGK